MAAMRFEPVQRFISAKKIFWGWGHFKFDIKFAPQKDNKADVSNVSPSSERMAKGLPLMKG